jgi:hypothetical protein
MTNKLVLCAILTCVCLAFACDSASFEGDVKVVCDAGGVAQVSGVPVSEKKAALENYVNTNVKTDEGRTFATELFALPPTEQLAKLEGGMKTAKIDAARCPTHALITQLVASQK